MDISDQLLDDITKGRISFEALRNETYKTIKTIDLIRDPLTYEEFFRNYLLANRPCLLDTWATESWLSRHKWTDDLGCLDLSYLEKHFGDATVPVANCKVEKYSSHEKEEMLMRDYITYMKSLKLGEESSDDRCLYLKDWHFTREFPDYDAYKVPLYFCSDWLNESWDSDDSLSDDYRFVYFGPTDSWTPFHADVFKSYSWSANVAGCKKWILFPPGEELQFKDKFGNLRFDLGSHDLQNRSGLGEGHPGFEVIQRSGQVLFVPTGWHHQVWNLEDTISINHNWFNGCNIDLCWSYLNSCLRDVQKEINDCRDMEGWNSQCQLVLKASCGMDFIDFMLFLQRIAKHRMNALSNTTEVVASCRKGVPKCAFYSSTDNPSKSSENYYNAFGKNQALFDLYRIQEVMSEFVETVREFEELDFSRCDETPEQFLSRLKE